MKDLLKFDPYSYLLIGFGLFFSGCGNGHPGLVKNYLKGEALGTTYNITYLSSEEREYQREIDSVFEVINKSMSTYLPESDISRINKGDTSVVVDAMFREVFELSEDVNQNTWGYFDPTVGILVDAWGFGPGSPMELDSTKVDSLLEFVGFEKVRLTKAGRIVKAHPQIAFDFNAIAKGYAIDRLGVMLDLKKIEHYLIEVGGEIIAKGTNSLKEKAWVVGVEDPMSGEERKLKARLELKNMALASSGNYRKFRVDPVSGLKLVHTIDPTTGYTKNSRVLGASVLARTCAEADAYATAFMAMDLEKSKEVLGKNAELDAYIIFLDEKGEQQVYMTEGFSKVLLP